MAALDQTGLCRDLTSRIVLRTIIRMAVGVTDAPVISPPLYPLDYLTKAAFARDYLSELVLRFALMSLDGRYDH